MSKRYCIACGVPYGEKHNEDCPRFEPPPPLQLEIDRLTEENKRLKTFAFERKVRLDKTLTRAVKAEEENKRLREAMRMVEDRTVETCIEIALETQCEFHCDAEGYVADAIRDYFAARPEALNHKE